MIRYASSPLPVLERLRPLLVPDDIEGDDKLVDMFWMFWRMETIGGLSSVKIGYRRFFLFFPFRSECDQNGESFY